MANENQPIQNQFQPQQGPFMPRMWGYGMGQQPMMPFNPQQPMPPQMGNMGPFPQNQMPGHGQAPQYMPNQPINHPLLDEKGNFDFNKLMGHADNVHKFINTARPMMKQLSPFFNMFKGS